MDMRIAGKRFFSKALLAAASAAACASAAAFVLPTPENNSNASYGFYLDGQGQPRPAILMNGIPVALRYDDFWSYSAKVLDAMQTDSPALLPVGTFGVYDFNVGTGNIAVNLASNAGGATNLNANGTGINFQDPVNLASSNANNADFGWTGVWGGLNQSYNESPASPQGDYSSPAANQGGVTTVGNLLVYLNSLVPDATIPVLYADYNQTGSEDSLWFSAMVQIFDSTGTQMKAQWNLDSLTGNGLNIDDPTLNYGQISFYGTQAQCDAAGPYNPVSNPDGCAGVTANGDTYSVDHNRGSGSPDFLAYAPTMDLGQFLSTDLFVVTMNVGCIAGGPGALDGARLGCNTNGGEEFGIVGAVGRIPPPPELPLPGSLALLGVGLLGAAGILRRRRS